MTIKLIDGVYARDAQGNLLMTEYTDQLFQDAVLMISAKRGRFYPDKNFGNHIKNGLNRRELLAYARQAVSSLDGVCIKDVQLDENGVTYTVFVQNEERQVTFEYDKL